jgi:hypothetical protein
MFIIELTTTDGILCERHDTYDDARKRIEQFPPGAIVGMPLVFQELPDGSQRLVREDAKPLQWHRLPEDRQPAHEEPIPLVQEALNAKIEFLPPQPEDLDDTEPLPLEP